MTDARQDDEDAGLDDSSDDHQDESVPPPEKGMLELLGLGQERPKPNWRRLPGMVATATRLVWAAAGRRGAVVAAAGAVTGLGVGAQLLAGNDLLHQALTSRAAGGGLEDLVPEAMTVAIISAVIAAVTAVSSSQQRLVGELVRAHTTAEVMRTAAAIDLVQFEEPSFYDRVQRASAGGSMYPWSVANGVLSLTTSLLSVVAIGVALVAIEPILVLPTLVAVLPLWFVGIRNAGRMFSVVWGNTADERERGYLSKLVTSRDSAKEVRAFNLDAYLRNRHAAATRRILERLESESWRQVRRTLAGKAASALAVVAGGGVLLWLLVEGRLEVAGAVTAGLAMQQLRGRLQGLSFAATQIYESALYLDDYMAFIALRPTERDAERPVAAPFTSLRAEKVGFTYPGAPVAALSGVDVEVGAGEVVALVGENGSGKTTLAKVLCGLYDPTAGRVTWDGHDVAELDVAGRRHHGAVIFQDFVRYALPARDNIGLGRTEWLDDDDRVRRAAALVNIDAVFDRLGDGWATVLGREFDGGQDLSLGQWQRVALARAFFRDAPFLVLDEPTASLDPRAEYRLFSKLRSLAAGRAVLLITHRFGNVRMADRIYVLHRGRVVEHGTHEELVAAEGRYAELFDLQARQLLGQPRPS